MFSKKLECLDCGFEGRAARELTFCPNCQSSNILTMSNKQVRQARRRKMDKLVAVVDVLRREDEAIKDAFSQLSHL